MDVSAAQREVRTTYMGGFPGHLVIGVLWLLSAALTTWVSLRVGGTFLVAGGFFIYPLTQLVLRLTGRPAALPANNPFKELAIESAFIVGPLLPLVGAATLHKAVWFYPGMMLVIGAHYLPFAFLYGMRHYLVLAALLCFGGIFIGLFDPNASTLCAWLTGALCLVFAAVARAATLQETPDTGEQPIIA
jgi:hypothetical protein